MIVEPDSQLRRRVRREFEREGFAVSEVGTVAAASEWLLAREADVVILALTLPDGAGLGVLRELRGAGSVVYVIATSAATSEAVRVGVLALGADDYVVKPFFVRELVGRVVAVRRRREAGESRSVVVGHLVIDVAARTVTAEGQPIGMTGKEFDLLAFLATHPGTAFGHDELLRAVWRSSAALQHASTVTEHVRRLRAKIEVDPQHPKLVVTVRGRGYRLVLPESATPSRAA